MTGRTPQRPVGGAQPQQPCGDPRQPAQGRPSHGAPPQQQSQQPQQSYGASLQRPRRVHPGVLAGVGLWRLLVAGCALYGVGNATGWNENFEALSQLASLFAGIVYLGLLAYPLFTGGRRHEPRSPWLRGATTVLLLLVAGVYFGLLGGDADHLPFEHIVTPLLVFVDWCAVGRNQAATRWWHPLTWIALPLVYLVYYLAAGLNLYAFLDSGDDGFAGMLAMLLVAVIAAGYVLYGIGKLGGAVRQVNTPAASSPHVGPPMR
ncbi:hypothetical protein GCM10009676_00380 [Prauserella halophila]|uniref:Integral membrane protein n=1 Tax=Prauserella halophila TaxID=185641 RepID=A0ABN1VX97_9PSEU|nr:hypothetical protein [Prauserella halophila]MCP2234618.1 hypothetical protein [Prauserella halophila]